MRKTASHGITGSKTRYRENKEEITVLIGKKKLLDWLLFIVDPDSEYARLAENADEAITTGSDPVVNIDKRKLNECKS